MAGLNGPQRSLSSYRGRPLIVNVWASWCGPCRAESASLERLSWRGRQPVRRDRHFDRRRSERGSAVAQVLERHGQSLHRLQADARAHARRDEHPAHGAGRRGRSCRREVSGRATMGQRRIHPDDRARIRRSGPPDADTLGVVGVSTSSRTRHQFLPASSQAHRHLDRRQSADRWTRNGLAPMLIRCLGNTCAYRDSADPKSCRWRRSRPLLNQDPGRFASKCSPPVPVLPIR